MSGGAGSGAPQLSPAGRAEWRAWLAEHHLRSTGVWLVVAKKGAGRPGVTYDEAVEEALCFGWIDSRMRPLDDRHFEQWYCPRRPGSVWSRTNKERVERLRRAGLMQPTGLSQVETAMADGSWRLLDEVEALMVPADLAAALAGTVGAAAGFAGLSPADKKALLYWVVSARRPQTRAGRVAAVVAAAAEGRSALASGATGGEAGLPRATPG